MKTLGAVLVGFLLYPLLFIPLLGRFWFTGLDKWLDVYEYYLKLWGI